ncbi:hypothetical protein RJ639_028791 [Escallonia herrerae]|uniref:Plant heme peroxidase family profile domain-containing protein n=1 Tax=Escallonia herrerae TaxID=1293975 RepID=A0AA88X6M2_9ASTE|nr:hypothetical protein RJ639_028791 [Escallonia herrerae]
MTTTGFDPSPLCSTTASYSTRRFSFPASICATLPLSEKKWFVSVTGESNMCIAYGRRTLVLVSTMSYLLPLHKSMQVLGANAAEFMESLSLDGDCGVGTLNFFDCREEDFRGNTWYEGGFAYRVMGSWMLIVPLPGASVARSLYASVMLRLQRFGVAAFHCFGGSEFFLIQGEVRKVLSKGKAAGVLRLVFHDAGTFTMDDNSGGMNGSIVYELDRPENGGLKKSVKASSLYLIIAKAKSGVDIIQPVSWADMIAVAGAEAVLLCGGPQIPVRLGRIDSLVPDPEGKLPEETLDASALKQSSDKKASPGMTSMIGLPSDRALVQDDDCLRWISKYANDQDLFFDDFKNAYIKLVNSGARWRKSL